MIGKSTFVVFDLDDTLYPEHDYQTSGLKAVASFCKVIYGINPLSELLRWRDEMRADIFQLLCKELSLPSACKESFIWIYRNHYPSIDLDANVRETLNFFKTNTAGLAILTDGRSISQRLKIEALGLSGIPAYISEEFEDKKPSFKRYELIEFKYMANHYVYIADNPAKDFLAPNQMGWLTIGMIGKEQNIHIQDSASLSQEYLPKIWVDRFEKLREFIC